MERLFLFSSESVSEGHPDKIADQISDAVLDAVLAQDPSGKVACETYVKTGMVLVGGEISTSAWVDIEAICRKTLREIGYIYPELGFEAQSCAIISSIGKQSEDIRCGVEKSNKEDQGAGDQGTMFGFATDETEAFMPAPIYFSHRLMKRHAEIRRGGTLSWLRPDAKCQITFKYRKNGTIENIHSVVFSTQHSQEVPHEIIQQEVMNQIILPELPEAWLAPSTSFFINPTGRFVLGGPQGDCGLTGRKIIVDTYGGMAKHGGGAFSGKDPSKVDRSAAYMARFLAKNIVAAGIAKRCEVMISYAIGVSEPVAFHVNTFNTGRVADETLEAFILKKVSLTPYSIIKQLNLLRPIYQKTAVYGHFGRDGFPWEDLTLVPLLKSDLAS